ncbi:MAG: glucosamine-6-phosphate deaminase [Firmicutes bacterium]|nr:glucosamine-6-phosphate deaminase [Bacillota bacterium]
MKIIICENYDELSEKAFEVMKEVVTSKERPVLGLATGSSPIGLYKCMIKDHVENHTDYSKVTTFNLDEYVGLPREHSQTYYTFMHENLFEGIEIPEENVHLPLGNGDLEKNCADYEKAMEDYTVDIQLLGIGSNGHIGFNEPGTSFDSLTHVVELKESTRKDNARFFDPLGEEVPTHACTMGIATIMKSKKVLVVANGANKADAVYNMVKGPVSEDCPASVLQNHPDVVLIVDRAAGKKL